MRIIKYIILLLIFCSCYSEKKATQQFDRAALAYPRLPAAYCQDKFPCIDSFIHGNPVYQFDTLYIPGDTISVPNGYDLSTWADKVIDTVYIYSTKVITKTVTRTDTIKQTDKAALKLCDLDRGNLISQLNKKTIESDSWQKKAKTRFWEVWLLAAIILGYTGFKLYMAFKPKISLGT